MGDKSFDADETIRNYIMRQLEKLRRIAPVGSLIILTINLAFTVYPYVAWRGIHPYIGVTAIALLIAAVLLFAAYIWMDRLEMYRSELKAAKTYNPYAVYALQPYEEMWFRLWFIPMMKYALDEDKDHLKENLEKVEEWVERGYIPKEQFPEHLKKYYITDKEQRL